MIHLHEIQGQISVSFLKEIKTVDVQGGENWLEGGIKELSRMIGSRVYGHNYTSSLEYTLNMCISLYVNFTTVKIIVFWSLID